MVSKRFQEEHCKRVVNRQQGFLSCGYETRFDPELLSKTPSQRKRYERVFRKVFRNSRFENMLDVCCGTAFYFPVLKEYSDNLTGIDLSEELVTEAEKIVKKYRGMNVRPGDVENIPFEDNSFDCVFCADSLHHIHDIDKALSEIRRVLKRSGIFIAVEPNMINPVVFLAHLLPAEERGAISRNFPFLMKKRVGRYFDEVCISYINYVAGQYNKKTISLLMNDHYPGCLSIRMIIRAR